MRTKNSRQIDSHRSAQKPQNNLDSRITSFSPMNTQSAAQYGVNNIDSKISKLSPKEQQTQSRGDSQLNSAQQQSDLRSIYQKGHDHSQQSQQQNGNKSQIQDSPKDKRKQQLSNLDSYYKNVREIENVQRANAQKNQSRSNKSPLQDSDQLHRQQLNNQTNRQATPSKGNPLERMKSDTGVSVSSVQIDTISHLESQLATRQNVHQAQIVPTNSSVISDYDQLTMSPKQTQFNRQQSPAPTKDHEKSSYLQSDLCSNDGKSSINRSFLYQTDASGQNTQLDSPTHGLFYNKSQTPSEFKQDSYSFQNQLNTDISIKTNPNNPPLLPTFNQDNK